MPTFKWMSEQDVEAAIATLSNAVREAYKQGLEYGSFTMRRSAVDVTEPDDEMRRWETGPTVRIELILRNPNDSRPEQWLCV